MNSEKKLQGSDLFIVDNSDSDWKVKNYLHEWTDLAHKFDIATGYFEIGSLYTGNIRQCRVFLQTDLLKRFTL